MRILKYILLLAILFFIGLSVYVSTQKADYNVTKSKIIKTPIATVYNFLNDHRNRELFDSRVLDDSSISFEYSEITTGKGATSSWKGSNDGKLITVFVKENDSISQKRFDNGIKSAVAWKFKDTIGGTKVTWSSVGKLDFKTKIISFFTGGVNSIVGNEYERSLENLNKTLNYELNTFDIKVNGIVTKTGTFYIKQSILSRQKDVNKNRLALLFRMNKFFSKNKMSMSGKPFISYSKYDKVNDLVGFSVIAPIKDSIFIAAQSDVQSGKLQPFTAVKITLTGDYSHTQKAWQKGYEYIAKNNLIINPNQEIIEIYTKGIADVKRQSQWVTEIYIPVFPKVVVVKPVYSRPLDSLAVKQNVPAKVPAKTPAKQESIPDEFDL